MFYYILSSLILASVVLHASYSYRLLQSTLKKKKSSFDFLVIYILFICVEGLKGTLLSGLYHTGG